MAAVQRAVAVMRKDPALEADPPSYFELVTAAAFLLASEERVDVAVVEAGLGGRLDATNLLGDVACSVVIACTDGRSTSASSPFSTSTTDRKSVV